MYKEDKYYDEYSNDDRNQDAHLITLCDADDKFVPQPSPLVKGISLNLSLAAEAKGTAVGPVAQEQLINVVFDLPDGSQGENSFKLGQSVEVLKSFVESEYGIPMAEQKLYFGDSSRTLLNPLSLMDYNETKGKGEVVIRVEGPLPRSSRK